MGYKRYYPGLDRKRIVFLNCRIMTTEGMYRNGKINLEEVKRMCSVNKVMSAIGHESTALILSELIGIDIPMNRIKYEQAYSDIAIVFQLRERIPEGKILSKEEIENIGYDFYAMFRIAGR